MKRMLMVATVPSMIGQFNMSNIQLLQDMGYEVEVACDFNDRSVWTQERVEKFMWELEKKNVKYWNIHFSRKILHVKEHIVAYRELYQLVKEQKYSWIHCHTPIGGAISRIVSYKTKTKIIYTAHGFHFYSGAPIQNWIIFYPIEKFLAHYTDVLITINKEDFKRAKKFKAKKVEYVAGVGVSLQTTLKTSDKEAFCKLLEIPEGNTILLSVGELNKNKNHECIIKAMTLMVNKNVHYIICGQGDKENYLEQLIDEYHMKERVHMVGYQTEITPYYQNADIFVFPSYREGLSVSMMEAISYGLPIVCSDIRGNRDLVIPEKGGYLVAVNDYADYACYLDELSTEQEKREEMSLYNLSTCEQYNINNIQKKMKMIYEAVN